MLGIKMLMNACAHQDAELKQKATQKIVKESLLVIAVIVIIAFVILFKLLA